MGPTLYSKLQSQEAVPAGKHSADDRVSFYVRAARYRGLLFSVAHRVLGNPDRADVAVENCLFSAARHVAVFDREGDFRSWLVRLAIDEALEILHGRKMLERRRGDNVAGITTALVSSRRNAA